jgi:hypothetical protein
MLACDAKRTACKDEYHDALAAWPHGAHNAKARYARQRVRPGWRRYWYRLPCLGGDRPGQAGANIVPLEMLRYAEFGERLKIFPRSC